MVLIQHKYMVSEGLISGLNQVEKHFLKTDNWIIVLFPEYTSSPAT